MPLFPYCLRRRVTPLLFLVTSILSACNQPMAVSINEQPVYDPGGRLNNAGVADANLQGCINIVMNQQGIQDLARLAAVSCANSDIRSLDNIERLQGLRFLDLSGNRISNLTPLEALPLLNGLILNNNAISDIGPLFNISTLSSVSLLGNNNIPCNQLNNLRQRLGDSLTAPANCRN